MLRIMRNDQSFALGAGGFGVLFIELSL